MAPKIPNIGEIVRNLRIARSMEQDDLAKKAGVSQPYISRIEKGTCNPSLKALRKIAVALGIDERTFFGTNVVISLDDDNISFGHLDLILRQFIAKEDSVPFVELAKELYDGNFTDEELEALKLIFLSRKRK